MKTAATKHVDKQLKLRTAVNKSSSESFQMRAAATKHVDEQLIGTADSCK